MSKEIMTVKEYKKAVKEAKIVFCQVRFGVSEKWVKLSKIEALALVEEISEESPPEDMEMYCGHFGVLEETGEFYIG